MHMQKTVVRVMAALLVLLMVLTLLPIRSWADEGDPAPCSHVFDKENTNAAGAQKSPATCTAPAVYYKSCSLCGAVSSSDSDTFASGEPLGHDFSVKHDAKPIFTYLFASLTFLSLPSALMLFMYREDLFGALAGPRLIILVFCLLWVNDIFAYLTGKLLGKHKLFPRISPGKTIEGSIGGLVFTMASLIVFCHYSQWFPITHAIGLAAVAVVFRLA